jgi:hypothetical protein
MLEIAQVMKEVGTRIVVTLPTQFVEKLLILRKHNHDVHHDVSQFIKVSHRRFVMSWAKLEKIS